MHIELACIGIISVLGKLRNEKGHIGDPVFFPVIQGTKNDFNFWLKLVNWASLVPIKKLSQDLHGGCGLISSSAL